MRVLAATAAWLVASATAFYVALDLDATPGRPADAPGHWPAGSALPRAGDRPTLLMFLHPRCPCSRASLDELEALLSSSSGSGGRLAATVVLDDSCGGAAGSGYWHSAAELPGVTPFADRGPERRRFGAFTSGETLLYAADGRLLFRGGITGGRGHRGDNPGRATVEALLRDPSVAAGASPHGPVYGCPLAADPGDPLRSTSRDHRDDRRDDRRADGR